MMSAVDFSRFISGSVQDRKNVASEIDNAFRTKGFVILRNHGILKSTTQACFGQSEQFFKLPKVEKEDLRPLVRSFEQGYIGVQREIIRGEKCMKENFDFRDPQNLSYGSWPTETQLPEFREIATVFYQECSQLINQLLDCLDLALDLDAKESLRQYHGGSMYSSNLVHHPEISAMQIRSRGDIRDPSHIDLSTLSLHFQRDVGGLQVADMSSTQHISSPAVSRSAKFYDIRPDEDTIMVNVGYLLMCWSNKRWKNSVHRVSIRGTEGSDGRVPARYSIAFFGFPDPETNIEPFASCWEGEKTSQQSFNAGEYLLRKREQLYH